MSSKTTQYIATGICVCLSASLQAALSQYTWNGSVSSDWTNPSNWNSLSIAPTGGVSDTRLNINNGANNELLYTGSMGTTVYAGTGNNPRSLVIGNASFGQLRITGGLLEGRGYGSSGSFSDVIGLQGGTGRLIVDGGSYYRTNDVPTSSDTGEELQIGFNYNNNTTTSGELLIQSGLAKIREIRMNILNLTNVSAAIHLDGGIFETFKIKASGTNGIRAVYFNGGTLKGGFADQADWFSNINAWVKDEGAVIDTAGFDNGLSSPLSADGNSMGGLTKKGNGRLSLAGQNTYRGLTSVTSGVLRAAHSNALGTTDTGTTVYSGARLELHGGITVSGEQLSLFGRGLSSDGIGALLSSGGTNTWDGPVTLMGDSANPTRIGAQGGDLIISGPINDNGNNYGLLIRNFDGNLTDTITLSHANTYAGRTVIYQGILKIAGGNNRLPTGSILQLGYYRPGYSLTGHFNLNGYDQELSGLEVNANITEDQQALRASQLVKNDAATPSLFTLNTSSDFTYSGTLAGNLGLIKKGTATFTISGTNVYTGPTSISNGVLKTTHAACLPITSDLAIAADSGAQLHLNFTGTNVIKSLSVNGSLRYREKVYSASELPGVIAGTGCLRTLEGIQGCLIQFF